MSPINVQSKFKITKDNEQREPQIDGSNEKEERVQSSAFTIQAPTKDVSVINNNNITP